MTPVETYISNFPPDISNRLAQLRELFFDVIPNTEESIRYNMPAFTVGKGHLYFAAYKKHIGFYPVYGLPEMESELEQYRAKGTKDTLHFLHSKPLPMDLVRAIIEVKRDIDQG